MPYTHNIPYIQDQVRLMADKVCHAVKQAVTAFLESNPVMAQVVVESDRAVNAFEMDIDAAVFKFFSLRMPTESEVRTLLAMQKITTSLERIGDHAVIIAESVGYLVKTTDAPAFFELPNMADLVQKMLVDSLESFFKANAALANELLPQDDAVDKLNASMNNLVRGQVMVGDLSFDTAMELVRVSRNLERIADLSTNIAEEAIFTTEARVVKHHAGQCEETLSAPG
jgi:phosphate transport system protein